MYSKPLKNPQDTILSLRFASWRRSYFPGQPKRGDLRSEVSVFATTRRFFKSSYSKNKTLLGVAVFLSLLIVTACSTTQAVKKGRTQDTFKSELARMFKTSDVFTSYFTGFELYDPQSDRVIYAQNETKYFTPASNTKLYTFYTALKYLPEKLPALQYIVRGDSLIFWGTGDPSFLRPGRDSGDVYHFLEGSSKKLYFSDSNFKEKRFGSGWMWDDYLASWQKERSPLPMYGNLVRFSGKKITATRLLNNVSGIHISPPFFAGYLKESASKNNDSQPLVGRAEVRNRFNYEPQADTSAFTVQIPYHYTPQLVTKMLSDTLHKPVEYIHMKMPAGAKTIYSVSADSIYKHMLLPSDNFIAEQLLLVTAACLGHPLNTSWMIDKMEQTYLKRIPDAPQWFDGSGVSRYDLFTPRDMVWLLNHIRTEFPSYEKLFGLLPAGGKTGTLSGWLDARDGGPPYVHAKTGTVRNNHTLSGYIETKSGHVLIFSFMNNHYITSSSVVNKAMENVLWFIHEHY